ncbi:phospholipase B1, membrane-associated [Tupaia chinensis]|uniref:phospholipase B1, membrane-associated n=1 Tax=Tupaia chinensis TaxID=246437 RepID=UPI00070454C0|nr:phospholipase B1, membrane-associated [Tupaia chinensis]
MQWFYQKVWQRILALSKYNTQELFTVVFQPVFYNMSLLPISEESLLQDPTMLAWDLWNSMITPTRQKKKPFSTEQRRPVKCPSQENPYLFTYKNDGYQTSLSKFQAQPQGQLGAEVRCRYRDPSNPVPTSVHRLRPADIKVIGALGDSITAALGARARRIEEILVQRTEFRGVSWSAGGDETVHNTVTLPNILREFSHNLRGFSTGTGNERSANAAFNQAKSGDKAGNLLTQAGSLLNLLRTDQRINFRNDWKIITVFIGGNDLCNFCTNKGTYSAENYSEAIKNALDFLQREIPRVFVNLVNVFQMASLGSMITSNCRNPALRALCPCLTRNPPNREDLAAVMNANRDYHMKTHELIESGRYNRWDNFTVVLQPMFENTGIPTTEEGLPDVSLFAPDCFHFSQKGHDRAARYLWRNMLEPVRHKTRQSEFRNAIAISCPTQTWPFLSTHRDNTKGSGTWLECTNRSPSSSPPTSVHALRPADIQVVAALGDSISAGNGAGTEPDNISDVMTQYRGLAFSSGGDEALENVTTLPNILRKFNANLKGFALGIGTVNDSNAALNQAFPGAKSGDLEMQVQALVERMRGDSQLNFQENWKLITVMIGNNDLCDYCSDSNVHSAANFIANLRQALDMLFAQVPRTLVNVVEFIDPIVMRQMFQGNEDRCPSWQAGLLCNCVLTPWDNSPELARLQALAQAYRRNIRQLVSSSRYQTKDDFAVVLQPFTHTIQLPVQENGIPDATFFAPDCIHPSERFHAQLSRALWVNMLEPVGRKMETLNLAGDIPLTCPTENDPFLRTSKNSNVPGSPGGGGDRPGSPGGPEEPGGGPGGVPGGGPGGPSPENWGSDLDCQDRSPSKSVPTSVHQLRPADIKVVAALGDALTTARGARPSAEGENSTDWKGLSWSIGGEEVLEKSTTLPNILKKFNSKILGFSTADDTGLNMAEEGARAQDMKTQAQELVKRIKQNAKIDLKNDWKLVTIFIGGNDLCHYCEETKMPLSAKKYVDEIKKALDILHKELPNTFVNLVDIMELASLYQGPNGRCGILAAQSICNCLFDDSQSSPAVVLQQLREVNWDFQRRISELSYLQQYTNYEDFIVVMQPFFENTLIPLTENGSPDLTLFSDNCLYFSERGQAEMAIALWNNMLEPIGQKTTTTNFTYSRKKLKCPSPEKPYLYTLQNSELFPAVRSKLRGPLYWAVIAAALATGILGVALAIIALSSLS